MFVLEELYDVRVYIIYQDTHYLKTSMGKKKLVKHVFVYELRHRHIYLRFY